MVHIHYTKVKFCFIGAGRAGMVNARNFEFNIAESEVVAVVDSNLEAARKAAEELNSNDYYNSSNEALIESDFDSLCIGAPSFVHCEAVVKAAEAGKHIYSENPLSISLEEADKSWKTLFKDAYKEGARHFVNCILTDSEPKVGIIDSKKALEIVIVVNKSVKIGTPIDL